MPHIPIGTKGEFQTRVSSEIAITFLGNDRARVLSTPQMIGLMERTCRDTVLPLLDSGFDTVGTHVDVYHRAAAPLGAAVKFTAEVISVDGRRIRFRVEALSGQETVGEGTHERTVINVEKFAARQAEKRQQQ